LCINLRSIMEIAALYDLYLQHPNIQTDTRKLQPGELFFALSGANFDGNAFAARALEMGAAYAIIDNPEFAAGDRYIVVHNALDTLQQLARHHRRQFNIPFIAITGSNGKTTTKELVAAVLKAKFTTYATEGNLNNHIGVPLTILKIRQDAEMAIIEMGANHLHEIAGYCQIAEPDFGIITNCGRAHLEGFGSPEGVRKAKGELYDFIRSAGGSVFLNTDLDYLREMSQGVKNIITYGSAPADYVGRAIEDGVFLSLELEKPVVEKFTSQLVGGYNFPNVMAAIAVGLHFGVGVENIKSAIASYSPGNSRSQFMVRGTNQIILDAYNANPSSMREAISNFAQTIMPHKRLWLGGMKEMGAAEHKEHWELVHLISQYSWEQVILVGNEFRDVAGSYLWFENSASAAAFIQENPVSGCSVLIKGSRGSKMEVMLEAL